jgi:ATP adenylyltransferase
MDYIRSLEKPASGCFLCEAAALTAPQVSPPTTPPATPQQLKERLIVWSTEHSTVMLNRFPYTNGHLLVSPRRHVADLPDLTPAEMADLHAQTARAITLLRDVVSAQGFNIGINLGRCAGAGVPGHLHQHLVPRWGGDVNFMAVVGEVRVVPQALQKLYDELVAAHLARP